MNVRLMVLQGRKVLERYTVPVGSWVQTETLGAQHASAVLKPTIVYESRRGESAVCVVSPINPPEIRPELLKMVNGRDGQWGRNGWEYMGCNRERQGGTALDRLSELASWNLCYGKQGPVPFLLGEAQKLSEY